MKIEEAIQQKAFRDVREKAVINLAYTASWVTHELMVALKPSGISVPQFNIMRILRGQQGKPVSLKLVTGRMIDKMSNTSRLIDKLVARGLVDRKQCPMDRRQVELLLTEAGHNLLASANVAISQRTHDLLSHMPEPLLTQFNDLLDEIRERER